MSRIAITSFLIPSWKINTFTIKTNLIHFFILSLMTPWSVLTNTGNHNVSSSAQEWLWNMPHDYYVTFFYMVLTSVFMLYFCIPSPVAKIDSKWWPYIDVIGYQSNLLQILEMLYSDQNEVEGRSAWGRYGDTGWVCPTPVVELDHTVSWRTTPLRIIVIPAAIFWNIILPRPRNLLKRSGQ